MGQAQISEKKYTFEEYLKMEEQGEIRHEYYDGEIFAMAGTTMNHNRIVGRIRSFLEGILLPKGCDVFAENVKVEAIQNFYYPYPDVILTCAPKIFQAHISYAIQAFWWRFYPNRLLVMTAISS